MNGVGAGTVVIFEFGEISARVRKFREKVGRLAGYLQLTHSLEQLAMVPATAEENAYGL